MRHIFLGLVLFVAFSDGAYADKLGTIRTILKLPDNQIDLGRVKLTIDKMIDPTINIKANLEKIDSMVAEIQMGLPFQASNAEKLDALRKYIYTANGWNGHQPYGYDFSDPFGRIISHKLLPNYLKSKKGNCVSMPFLFIILGQRLGIDVTAALAPEHIFVKYRDDIGNWINLETTSGATPARDVWIRQQKPMTDKAVANGVYLRPLSKKETVALMAEMLIEHYMQKRQYQNVIDASDLVLEYSPKSVSAMLFKGDSYAGLVDIRFKSRYPSPNMIPDEEWDEFMYLHNGNRMWFAKAESLGWREPAPEQEERYRQTINTMRR